MIDMLAHLFVPRSSNNHKAKLIHNSSLLIIVFLFIAIQFVLVPFTQKTGQVLGFASNISPFEVERLTNVKRAENGLSPVTDNPDLDRAAASKGHDMFAKNYWAHVAPDGTQPWAFFAGVSYDYRYAGENLARDFSDAPSAVDAWMASPSHRENMLSDRYKEIGVAVVDGKLNGVDTTIIVQFFGTKMGEGVVQKVTPSASPIAALVSPTPAPAVPTVAPTTIPTFVPETLVDGTQITPFNITRYLSLGLIGSLILIVAIDGILINKRKIFRVAGHWVSHFAFLGMILAIIIIAKAGRII